MAKAKRILLLEHPSSKGKAESLLRQLEPLGFKVKADTSQSETPTALCMGEDQRQFEGLDNIQQFVEGELRKRDLPLKER